MSLMIVMTTIFATAISVGSNSGFLQSEMEDFDEAYYTTILMYLGFAVVFLTLIVLTFFPSNKIEFDFDGY